MANIKTLADKADRYYTLRQERLAKQKEVDAMQAEESALKDELINSISKAEVGGVAGSVCRVTVVTKPKPKLVDFDALIVFIRRRNAWELIRHAINEAAVKERLEAGQDVPGVEVFNVVDLSVNKL